MLAAIGTIFIFNSPVKLAVNWFKTENMPFVIFGTVLSNLISVAAGASIPGFILNKQSTT
jgi:hypothetical protein